LDDGKSGGDNTFSLIKGKYSFGYLNVAFTLELGVKQNFVLWTTFQTRNQLSLPEVGLSLERKISLMIRSKNGS